MGHMPPWGVHLNVWWPARTPAQGVACLGPEAAGVPPDPPGLSRKAGHRAHLGKLSASSMDG